MDSWELRDTGILTLRRRLAGYGYHKYYKHLMLEKIDKAFDQGDPALDLASEIRSDPKEPWYDSEPLNMRQNVVAALQLCLLVSPKTCPASPRCLCDPSMYYYSMRRTLSFPGGRDCYVSCFLLLFCGLTELVADDLSCLGSN